MANTLATRQQAAAIRQRMQEIRTELPYDVDEARERVKQLSDWKYHMSRNSIPILVAAAIAGYLIIPRKRASSSAFMVHREHAEARAAPAKRGLIGGIAGAAATMILRQAASVAVNQLTDRFSNRQQSQHH